MNSETIIGHFDSVKYVNQVFTISYIDGEICKTENGDRKYDAVVTIVCRENSADQPEFDFISNDGCSYNFIWYRNEACLSFLESSCGIIPVGYNLSPLQTRQNTPGGIFNRLESEKLASNGVTTPQGECHFPFTYTRGEKKRTFRTCTDYSHYATYWCCLESKCSKDSEIGICPNKRSQFMLDNDWEAVTLNDSKNLSIFISICGELNRNYASEKCPEESLICVMSDNVVKDITATE